MNNKITSFYEAYKLTLKIADKKTSSLNKSYLAFIISNIAQGLGFAFFFPLLSTLLNDKFILDEALFWLLIITLLTIVSVAFKWYALRFNYTEELTDVTHDLRLKLGSKIKKMPLQKLNKYRTGELNSVIAQNVDESVLHMGVVAGMAFEAIIIPFVIIAATFFINIKMAFALLLAFPFAIPIYKWSRKITKTEKTDNMKAHTTLEADTIEYLQGLPVLRSLNQVGKNASKLQESILKVREVQKRGMFNSTIPMVILSTLVEFVFLMVLALGSLWITEGSFTIASLISLLVLIGRVSEPLSNFLAIASVLDIMEAGFKNIEKILNEKPLEVSSPKQKAKNFDITFEDVTFNYLDSKNSALKNVNLKINSKSLTAIVGPSGSGKTTITKLIMRYDDPLTGNIKIGNTNIKNMTQEELMSNISVVFQDVYLFDDTILNNIRMGNPNAKDEEVIKAAKKAHCHEFIKRLEKGYETTVGEIGGSLSGGERQRISIARAILKDSAIVILDEPTSALDTQSELAVQEALDELIKDKTVIVIAHRLSTISHADKILVLENGTIIENGKHEELIANKARYYSMYQAQQRIKQWNISYD